MPKSDYVDLQPGWKIRVVIPKLRSGGYILPSMQRAAPGNTEIEAGDDFLGYEADTYRISARRDGGILVRFSRAEAWENGKRHTLREPALPLFREAVNARHVRLVYLIRESKTDHDMAIVAAEDSVALEELTRAVMQRAECGSAATASCTWVPNGVAVTPQER